MINQGVAQVIKSRSPPDYTINCVHHVHSLEGEKALWCVKTSMSLPVACVSVCVCVCVFLCV